MRLKIFPTVAAVTWLPVEETKNVRRDGPNRAARCPVAGGQDLGDLAGQRQPAAAVALGGHDVEVPVAQVDVLGRRARASPVRSPQECISVKNATACHRHGELACSVAAAAKNASISWRLSR